MAGGNESAVKASLVGDLVTVETTNHPSTKLLNKGFEFGRQNSKLRGRISKVLFY